MAAAGLYLHHSGYSACQTAQIVAESKKNAEELQAAQAETLKFKAIAQDWDNEDDKDINYGIKWKQKYMDVAKAHPMPADCRPDAVRLRILKQLRTPGSQAGSNSPVPAGASRPAPAAAR
jgi:hypothetical protein